MELVQLDLKNFRQFKDDTVEFSQGSENGVTVIHGSNGSGKTTLLNAFTWLFYGKVDFDTRPGRLVNEGEIAGCSVNEKLPVSVRLNFEHEGTEYIAYRRAVYQKGSETDFDGELVDMDLTVKYRDGRSWSERGNPANTLDQIIPERLSSLFFFDGEDIEELAGIDNQGRIQESIQNIMGLTILERATRHANAAAGRFEDEVEQHASEELSDLIEEKRDIEARIEDLERKNQDTVRARDQITQEIRDIEQKMSRLDESDALQSNRKRYQNDRNEIKTQVERLNEAARNEVKQKGFVPLSMPLIQETAEKLDKMREDGVIPSELNDSYIDSLLETEQCVCGRPLEPGTEHYQNIQSQKGNSVADGVEQSALRIISHLNQFSDMQSSFFENVDEIIEERKRLHDEVDDLNEKIDDVTSELQDMDQTTESGESVKQLEAQLEIKVEEKEELNIKIGQIEQQIQDEEGKINEIEDKIGDKQDEREEALLAKRRQTAAELVEKELDGAFEGLKDKIRKLSNKKIRETFGSIASKDMTAEITDDFELKIWQRIGGDRVEVDKSTGERQIASLAFIGSLVAIARQRYETDSDSDYFTGGIYPLVMDSPFGALDMEHRREVSRVIPELANQVVVFATDSQWKGPVEGEMSSRVGSQYWLDFDDGDGDNAHPQTTIRTEQAAVGGD
jgi:DNA sulfur modification protein DndD